jgi:hypothetical protein
MQLDGINREQLVASIKRLEGTLGHARALLASMDGDDTVLVPEKATGKLILRRDLYGAIKAVVPKDKRSKGSQWTMPWLRDLIMNHPEHRHTLLRDGRPDPNLPLTSFFSRNSDPKRVKHPLLKMTKKAQGQNSATYQLLRGLDDSEN